MSGPPPPPPPHGENPKTTSSNLPPGKYDIFIIPPHSSGSGFLYLPSLQPNVNSFVAGFASALVLVVLGHSMAPAFKTWWNGFQGMGSVGILLLVVGVALGAWSLGRTQTDGVPGSGGSSRGPQGWGPSAGGGFDWTGTGGHTPEAGGPPPPPPPHSSPPPKSGPMPGASGGENPKGTWQQRPQPEQPPQENREQPPPKPERKPEAKPAPRPEPKPESQPNPSPQANPWEKAREETRKREAERKAKEAEQKRKEEVAKRLKELREKEARERAKREQVSKDKTDKDAQEKAAKEKAAKEKAEVDARSKEQAEKAKRDQELKEKLAKEKEQRESRLREARERDLRDRLEREKQLREKLEKEAKEREATRLNEQAKEDAAEAQRKSTYAYSSAGEKFNLWPNGRPPDTSPAPPNPNPSSPKRPPAPTAKTFTGTTDEDAYSYRPYDEPKRQSKRRSGSTVFTEFSYAQSQSTARTSPPPSVRGTYSTKDPNKIVIKAVYGFMNQFSKTPASQLISGQGPVTDGLILRITTEGLFIDDDVRGVPQREWDVKAWTLKLMEVWCPSHSFGEQPAPQAKTPNVLHRPARTRVDRGVPRVLIGDEADKFCETMLRTCKTECSLCLHGDYEPASVNPDAGGQAGEWKQQGLHVLRANIRDQEGKRYMFVLGEEEGWKVALGLQRLRKGTQVRQLGVQAMSAHEARNTIETLGWY